MNVLVVGCGLAGITYARFIAEAGHHVTIIDKRDHVAGNVYDYFEDDIRVHKYGLHIFHTNNDTVIDWLSKFTGWVEYKHISKALYNDHYYPIPINKYSVERLGIDKCIEVFVKPYSEKMWATPYKEIGKSIFKRLPIKDDYNPYYFPNDKFQGFPSAGYTEMVNNILDHKNIVVKLSTPFEKKLEKDFDYIFNSMSIDDYYGYIYGELPYRSIKYDLQKKETNSFLDHVQVVFTTTTGPTRVIEWKKLPNHGDSNTTLVTYETPCGYKENNYERYYPMVLKDNSAIDLYNKYKSIENKKMKFIGRCGTYQYLNMDQVINQSIIGVNKWLNG